MTSPTPKRRDPRGLKDWRGTKRKHDRHCACRDCLGMIRDLPQVRRAALDAREQMRGEG